MTIAEVLEFTDDIKPNAFSTNQKLQWINEAEGMVQTEVFLRDISEITVYTEADTDDTLLVRPPHDKLYIAYLNAMIDFANGEYERYQNSMAMFNSHYNEFVRWFASVYRPADHGRGRAVYYLTAYGIAVKHGYTGTEEEWLLSLKGEKGSGFTILGYYPNVEALTAAVTEPESGDCYGVGTEAPYDIYIWSGTWVNNGKIAITNHAELDGRDEADQHPISAITGLSQRLDESASWSGLAGKPFSSIGENLIVENGVLKVDTTNVIEQDNTKPVTSAAVHTEVGNIEVLLAAL